MNKWNYAVYETATKVAKEIKMGNVLTIEKVFGALKPTELLIRIAQNNEKKRQKFIGNAKVREWSNL